MAPPEDENYGQLVSLIGEVESSAGKQGQPTYIDLTEMFDKEEPASETSQTYSSLINELSSLEKTEPQHGRPNLQTPQPAAQRAGQASIPPVIKPVQAAASPQQAAQRQQLVTQAEMPLQPAAAETVPDVGEYMKSEKEAAKQELSNLIAGLKKFSPPQQDVKEAKLAQPQARPEVAVKPDQNAILPTLPLPEQVSELEKIEAGLREKVFDHEQLEIIRIEISALSGAKSSGAATKQDPGLAAVRDALLAEVYVLLGG